MTREQKALAHLARAQQLLNGQDTLAFGGVSDWSKDTRERKQFGRGPSTPKKSAKSTKSKSTKSKLLIATKSLLKRLGSRRLALVPPKSMLLSMSQVERIRNNQLVLPTVPPQDYNDTQILTALSEEIVEEYFYFGGVKYCDDDGLECRCRFDDFS